MRYVIAVFWVTLVFLASCATSIDEYRPKVALGTFDGDTMGIAMLVEFNFQSIAPEQIPILIYGPKSWNNDEPIEGKFIFPENEGGRKSKEFLSLKVPVISGMYTVVMKINEKVYEVPASVDATKLLPKPQNVSAKAAWMLEVDAKWQAVPGAELYFSLLFHDSPDRSQRNFNSFWYSRIPDADLLAPILQNALYSVDVRAYSYDFGTKTGVPSQFNVSATTRVPVTIPTNTTNSQLRNPSDSN